MVNCAKGRDQPGFPAGYPSGTHLVIRYLGQILGILTNLVIHAFDRVLMMSLIGQ